MFGRQSGGCGDTRSRKTYVFSGYRQRGKGKRVPSVHIFRKVMVLFLRRWGGAPGLALAMYHLVRNSCQYTVAQGKYFYARTTLGGTKHSAMVEQAVREYTRAQFSKSSSNVGHGDTQTAGDHGGDGRDFESVRTELLLLSLTLLQSVVHPVHQADATADYPQRRRPHLLPVGNFYVKRSVSSCHRRATRRSYGYPPVGLELTF